MSTTDLSAKTADTVIPTGMAISSNRAAGAMSDKEGISVELIVVPPCGLCRLGGYEGPCPLGRLEVKDHQMGWFRAAWRMLTRVAEATATRSAEV